MADFLRFEASQLMLSCGGATLAGVLLLRRFSDAWKQRGMWLVLAFSLAAVALAADVFGPATEGIFLPKLVMVALVVGALLLLPGARCPADAAIEASARRPFVSAARLTKTGILIAQLAALVLIIGRYSLVSPVFAHQLMFLTLYGFVVHYFLPPRLRLPFFVLLSLTALWFVFGIRDGGCMFAIGVSLIAICHLPVSFALRVTLLVIVGLGLGIFRSGLALSPLPAVIWPVLASMFMFRIAAYLYALKHQKASGGVWESLGYFFMLPNIAFPLFPVVDYTGFRRTYYAGERHLIYQTGVRWILRGVVHLLLYRLVYYNLVIPADQVITIIDLVRYLTSNFLLILRLSGQFHLVVGILHLFGFNLPEVMNRYWLASSFTDFWRRANIYWRDFMQRLVFFPIHFRLRGWPPLRSLAFASFVVFALTWALHSYQWFWLRGAFYFSGPDVLFWMLFGLLVIWNTLHEAKEMGSVPPKSGNALSSAVSQALRIARTFSVICLLWSLWISDSVREWLELWRLPSPRIHDGIVVVMGGAVTFLCLILWLWGVAARRRNSGFFSVHHRKSVGPFYGSVVPSAAWILALLLLSNSGVAQQLPSTVARLLIELQTDKLNKRDAALLGRGYYESLTRVSRFSSQLWEVYNRQPQEPILLDTGTYRETGTFVGRELIPSAVTRHKGEPFGTNRWGMRDKDYELQPGPGTLRMALLGGSYELGTGLANGETFESIVEERMNTGGARDGLAGYEILNFATGFHTTLQRLRVLETKALSFQPDLVIFTCHPTDQGRSISYLAEVVVNGTEIPYEYLREIIRQAGATGQTDPAATRRALRPYGNKITTWLYRRVVDVCRSHSITPVFLLLPLLKESDSTEAIEQRRLATDAGFVVIDVSDMFDHRDKRSLCVSDWDAHPNADAHRLIADRLYGELQRRPELLRKLDEHRGQPPR